jgi:hypothetical protein
MSPLGQKQTLGKVRPTSACPRKRTLLTVIGMSALCHFRTYRIAAKNHYSNTSSTRASVPHSI